jgi:hypothetical protein
MGTLVVETIEGRFELGPLDVFTFGRSATCTFCLDDTDRNISRRAGVISFSDPRWMLTNTSSKRPLRLTDRRSGTARQLMPGGVHVICEERLTVTVVGTKNASFAFDILGPSAGIGPAQAASSVGGAPSTLGPPALTPRQRQDLSALFWEYRGPDGPAAPRPLTYAEAAVLLGDTAKALEHRVTHLRKRLLEAGYPRMDLQELAVFLLATGSLMGPDFEALRA